MFTQDLFGSGRLPLYSAGRLFIFEGIHRDVFHILNWLKNPPSTRCPRMFLLGLNMISYWWFLQKCGCTWKFGWYSIWYIYSQNILSHKYSDCMSLYLWEPTVSLWGKNARPNGFEGIFEAWNVVLVSWLQLGYGEVWDRHSFWWSELGYAARAQRYVN